MLIVFRIFSTVGHGMSVVFSPVLVSHTKKKCGGIFAQKKTSRRTLVHVGPDVGPHWAFRCALFRTVDSSPQQMRIRHVVLSDPWSRWRTWRELTRAARDFTFVS